MSLIAILTPTYNRAYIIRTLYESLLKQSSYNFVWYVIDDGSTDKTEELIDSFSTDKFKIIYKKKLNGGKHTAINFGMKYIKEELTFIVDSDDSLKSNAIETICIDWKKYKCKELAGLSYYRVFSNDIVIGAKWPDNQISIDTFVNMRINKNTYGDKAEVWKTSLLKTHPFPEFEGERFLSEAIVWNKISEEKYKMVFLPKGIYICEYLEDGLTKQGRKTRLENFQGTMEHAKSHFFKEVNFFIRMKYMLYYTAVSIYSKCRKSAFKDLKRNYRIGYALSYLPAIVLDFHWKCKYK